MKGSSATQPRSQKHSFTVLRGGDGEHLETTITAKNETIDRRGDMKAKDATKFIRGIVR